MLYLNKLCRKPITTANYGAVYSEQLRKYFAKRNANAAAFFPLCWTATNYFSFYTIFQKTKIVFTPRIAAWATNGTCRFYTKLLGKEKKKKVKDFW